MSLLDSFTTVSFYVVSVLQCFFISNQRRLKYKHRLSLNILYKYKKNLLHSVSLYSSNFYINATHLENQQRVGVL